MKVEWNYTDLAASYVKRPDYSKTALSKMIDIAKLKPEDLACDVGAGVGHLTIPLLEYGLQVKAIEPNDAMRALGKERTKKWSTVTWIEGTGEETKQPSDSFSLVSFGSSFNVTDRQKALQESSRLLKKKGFFACMWNLRNLEDPLQKEIENIIKFYAKEYNYGARREDQTDIILKSNLFNKPEYIEEPVDHIVDSKEWVEAWRSHATVSRQVGDKLGVVVDEIEKLVANKGDHFPVLYITKIWVAQKIN